MDEIFRSERSGSFSYSIPVPWYGYYRVVLHFVEIFCKYRCTVICNLIVSLTSNSRRSWLTCVQRSCEREIIGRKVIQCCLQLHSFLRGSNIPAQVILALTGVPVSYWESKDFRLWTIRSNGNICWTNTHQLWRTRVYGREQPNLYGRFLFHKRRDDVFWCNLCHFEHSPCSTVNETECFPIIFLFLKSSGSCPISAWLIFLFKALWLLTTSISWPWLDRIWQQCIWHWSILGHSMVSLVLTSSLPRSTAKNIHHWVESAIDGSHQSPSMTNLKELLVRQLGERSCGLFARCRRIYLFVYDAINPCKVQSRVFRALNKSPLPVSVL